MGLMEQYERMMRSYEKLKDENRNQDNFKDDLFHFFMDAWHLKDWIINDNNILQEVKDNIRSWVKSSPALQICRHLADGNKHFVKKESSLASRHFALNITESLRLSDILDINPSGILFDSTNGIPDSADKKETSVVLEQIYEIKLENGKKTDSRTLSMNVIPAWNDILISNGLLNS